MTEPNSLLITYHPSHKTQRRRFHRINQFMMQTNGNNSILTIHCDLGFWVWATERAAGYESLIGIDLESDMADKTKSALLRVPFSVAPSSGLMGNSITNTV
ncbi:MAG: hypothetical protein R3F11_20505 [Verrucomicrobiales bacterium]